MQIKASTFCPLIQKECLGLGCSWFIQIRGKHPQTGADLDEWLCAIAATPVLQIAVAQEVRHSAAEINALRGDMSETRKSDLMAALLHSRPQISPAIQNQISDHFDKSSNEDEA